MASEERLRELEEKYEGFTVYDNGGSKIGKVDDLFVDESDNEEYIGVKMGLLGSKSTLIPTDIVRVNESDRTIEVAESKDRVKDAPSFSDDDEVTAEYEERIRGHFGLESLGSGRGSYGGHPTSSGAAAGGAAAGGATSGTAGRDDRESYGQDTREETYGSSSGGDVVATGSTGSAGYQQESGESSGSEEYREESGGPAGAGTQYGNTESSGASSSSSTGGSSGAKPTTTRQTEETETFQEGGRTKVRRRIIREEVVDADDQDANS